MKYFYVFLLSAILAASAKATNLEGHTEEDVVPDSQNSSNNIDREPQRLRINRNDLDALGPSASLQQMQGGMQTPPIDTLQGKASSQTMPDQFSVQVHGDEGVGVLGLGSDDNTGIITNVFPPSDLNRFGIHAGDRILGYMGHQYRNGMQAEVVGIPGAPLNMTILHDGQIITIYPRRIDARLLLPYDFNKDRYYSKCAAMTKYW